MILAVDHLAKRFPGGVEAVSDVSFRAGEGELIALVGESGCGKTTTLKCINRLLEPSGGRVLVEDEDIQSLDPVALRRRIGWVMQGDGLFPHMTAAENIAVGPKLAGWTRAQISARVDELLLLVRLDPGEYRDRRPDSLSGGQRQRIGVARALATAPRLVLMDEPFGALDPRTRAALRRDFLELQDRMGFAGVLVTHDMAEALLAADRIAVMHEGRILQYGAPDVLLNAPAHPIVEAMLESPVQEAGSIDRLRRAGTGDEP